MYIAETQDEGFTGAVSGVLQPRIQIIPIRWQEILDHAALSVAVQRRQMAIQTGSWWRGRILAISFTLAGIACVASVVGATRLTTAEGIISLSLGFTIWSFLGLLALPTLSRRGVAEVDQALLRTDCGREPLERTIETLDLLQDRERQRLPIIETIFHPVPSVEARLRGPHSTGIKGTWDAARTTVFLSAAGLSLLGRAVHCNCGRPALWVFLPID